MNTGYMFDGKWKTKYEEMSQQNYETLTPPSMEIVNHGIILPSFGHQKSWGLGGLLREDNSFVEESAIENAWGGYYEYDKSSLEYIDEEIIFIPIIPKQWGHFLIDVLSRFWFLDDYKEMKIAYCGWNWETNKIVGNYLTLLNLLGIDENRLLFIDHPVQYRKVYMPSRVFGFSIQYNKCFADIIQKITENAIKVGFGQNLPIYKKIYFTRREFFKAKVTEIGEPEIEAMFRKNGYTVLAPEKCSLIEQIWYVHNCDSVVCMSGTIPHNIMFASESTKLTIINRTCIPNLPQFKIDQLFKIDNTYVDCFSKRILKHPIDYGQVPIWIEFNANLEKYCDDNNLVYNKNIFKELFLKVRNFIQYYIVLLALKVALPFKNKLTFLLKKMRG